MFFHEILRYIDERKCFYGRDLGLVSSVYDCPGGLSWEGGRVTMARFSLEESVRRVKAYNERGLGFNIAFSNVLLTERELGDEYCNWFLEQCQSKQNGVIVASDLLRNHIRQNYPQYRLIASICFCRTDLEFYKKALDEYDLVVLHPDLNRDLKYIRQLDMSRLEVLVNEDCFYNCPNRLQHYKNISQLVLSNQRVFYRDRMGCLSEAMFERSRFGGELLLSQGDIDWLSDLGVRHFKLQGRQESWDYMHRELGKYVEQTTIRTILKRYTELVRE
ncbi:MAG: hypothetical protein C4575_13575 [Desulforudis sp.]|nr:hypothetical protein [Clostridia bacterium]RJX17281.1 MAG: hypothetical protein C4575_13575 [Desulforudis sp.]